MLKTDTANGPEADRLGTPEALRTLAERAKQFAASVTNATVRQRIIESAQRLEAEAALLEQLQPPPERP